MTFELVARTELVEAAPDNLDPMSIPFGRTGCALLPDGSYLVTVYYDTNPTDLVRIWKVGADGTVLGDLVIDTLANHNGRMHVTALDGYLAQVLYMTTGIGGHSYVVDASGDDPVLLEDFPANGIGGYGSYNGTQSLYLPVPGVAVVAHARGISLFRRGRLLLTRDTGTPGGAFGLYPHPSDPRKCAAWYAPYGNVTYYNAWEITVTENDTLDIAIIDDIPEPPTEWVVGAGSPYAADPLVLQETSESNGDPLRLYELSDLTTPVWTDSGWEDWAYGINSESLATCVGDGVDRFVFAHETWHEVGAYATPTGPGFRVRAGLVDGSGGTPVVEQLFLDYDTTTPSGYPLDEWTVSLITGSMCVDHRDGSIVISTCVVQQGDDPNYYSVVSWKLTAGDVARFSGLDGAWRRGINNRSGRTALLSSTGWLPEAGEGEGLDASARPAQILTSDGWKFLGRYVDPSEGDLPEPEPPETVDVTFNLTDINTDLAAAITLAGATYGPISGKTWGAFVAQGTPPTAAQLADGSDATVTTLVHPNNTGGPVEVFTAKLTPATSIPAGAVPIRVALNVRGRATSGTTSAWLDGLVTVPISQAAIRSQAGTQQLALSFDHGPALKTSSWGIADAANPNYTPTGGRTINRQVEEIALQDALNSSEEGSAQWWGAKVEDPSFYIVVTSASTNPTQGNLEIAEMSMTIKYLIL